MIATPRLDLHVLPLPLLSALVSGDVAEADRLAPFSVDAGTFHGDDHVLAMRLGQVQQDAEQVPWLLRAAVLRASGQVVGKVGFHAAPDATGTVEIGYRVSPGHRRCGFAREMAIALLRWGVEHGAARCLVSIRPDNIASLALTQQLGFVRIGEQIAEIDGLEWIFARPLDDPLPSYDDRR